MVNVEKKKRKKEKRPLNSHINVRNLYISQKEKSLPQKPRTTICKIGQNFVPTAASPSLFIVDVINE